MQGEWTQVHERARGTGTSRVARGVLLGAALALLSFGLIACGGDDDDGETAATNGEAEVCEGSLTLGTQPIAPLASVYLGVEQGFFEEEGIDLELAEGLQGGAASISRVVGGTDDLGFTDWVGMFPAVDRGLPIRAVAPAAGASPDEEEAYLGVLAGADTGIEEPEDLAGATVGVNALNNVTDVSIKAALAERGVDPDSVDFVEVPFPDTLAAVDQGRVDAAFFVEPFLGAGLGAGHTPVLWSVAEVAPEGAISAYFTSQETLDENECLIDGFVEAMNRANDYAAENPDELREVIPTFTQIPPDVAEQMRLPIYGEPGTAAPEAFNDAMVEIDLLDEPIDLDAVLAYPFD